MADVHLKAIITAVDRLSPVLAKQSRMIRGWSKQFQQAGRGAIPIAAGLGVALGVPARAFMEAEDAATQLQNTLMTKDGIAGGFEQLSKIAIDLGNKLPGTTADFMAMASQLKALGTDTDTLIGGALKASAYLAVVGKPLGVTYDSAAEAVGKLSNAFGIAAQDLVPFTDTVQRALHMGVELEQFQYAMARISGPLKAAGIQGIKVANDMTPLVGMLIKAGISGEEAGTGIKKMIEASIATGKFTGVTGLVKDLEKLNKLPVAEKMAKFGDLFGEMHAGKAAIVAAGGYEKMVEQMGNMSDLNQKIANSQKTLSFQWDAATGTFTNAMVAFADSYAPELKDLAKTFNEMSEKVGKWVKENKPLINTVIKVALGFVGLKLALAGIGWVLGSVSNMFLMFRTAIMVVTGALKILGMILRFGTPFGIFLTALAIAAPFIIANWDKISVWIKATWDKTVTWLASKWSWFVASYAQIKDRINVATQQAAEFFKGIWQGAIDWVAEKFQGLVGIVSSIAQGISGLFSGIPSANGMTLPGQGIQRPAINTGSRFQGSLDINHVGAPAGFRASPVKSKGPMRVNQNVGYNYSVTGLY